MKARTAVRLVPVAERGPISRQVLSARGRVYPWNRLSSVKCAAEIDRPLWSRVR